MNKEDRELIQGLRTEVALINAWKDSEFDQGGTFWRAIERMEENCDKMSDSTDSLKKEINDVKKKLAPIEKTVENAMKSLYWFLRIVGATIIIYVIHHYLDPDHEHTSSNTDNHQHAVGYSNVEKHNERLSDTILYRGRNENKKHD